MPESSGESGRKPRGKILRDNAVNYSTAVSSMEGPLAENARDYYSQDFFEKGFPVDLDDAGEVDSSMPVELSEKFQKWKSEKEISLAKSDLHGVEFNRQILSVFSLSDLINFARKQIDFNRRLIDQGQSKYESTLNLWRIRLYLATKANLDQQK